MADELGDQLQRAFGAAYVIERELGGGGMSRVFVATETAIGRAVVVKVLPPELAAGVNIDRFRREIQLAGKLAHPHIVGILSAGVADGLPYYTMPFVEGESLRRRIERGGALPLADVTRYLRGMLAALSYAHAHGVVHRDIKPDNVLLSGEFALVTDFGVAKALTDSANTGRGLTSVGFALGTPAYMAPEQAAADPNVDHRADLYALGIVAYEMLTGQPPFAARTPQAALAAHITEKPDPIEKRRPSVPPHLARLVLGLLEKAPADRPQRADDALGALDAIGAPGLEAASAGLPLPHRISATRAVSTYLACGVTSVALAWAAAHYIGLPTWVVPGVAIVMALGGPVVVLAILADRFPISNRGSSGDLPPRAARLAEAIRPLVAWRRVALGGAAALGSFGLFVLGYMVLRAFGIGPSGSLMAAGLLESQDRVLVIDFRSPPGDSTLGATIADALRIDLGQSSAVTIEQPEGVREALVRMKRAPASRLDIALAREVAAREGIKAIVDGEVASLGGGYIVSARLIEAESGDVLAAFRESARDANSLIPAVDYVSRQLRAKTGESLRRVNAAPPLSQVSTGSLEALRVYSQAYHAMMYGEPRFDRLMERAISLDSDFAAPYRTMSAIYSGRDLLPRAAAAAKRSLDLSAKLPPVEQHLAAAMFYLQSPDPRQATPEYEAVLALDPKNEIALRNLAFNSFALTHEFERAKSFLMRSMAVDSDNASYSRLFAINDFALGDTARAREALKDGLRRRPLEVSVYRGYFHLYEAIGRYDSAAMMGNRPVELMPGNLNARVLATYVASEMAVLRGRIHDGYSRFTERGNVEAEAGNAIAPEQLAIREAAIEATVAGQPVRAVRRLDKVADDMEKAKVPLEDRQHLARARAYALAGLPARARALATEYRTLVPPDLRGFRYWLDLTDGYIALAAGHSDSAVTFFRAASRESCPICALPELARAYDAAGQADSAIAVYERYVATPWMQGDRMNNDALWLASTYRRLGELYDARGDTEAALSYYAKFVGLWKDADPELQPQVRQVRRRIEQLAARKG